MPEAARFVGKLMVFRRDEFRGGHQRGEVEEELGGFGGNGVVDFLVPGALEPGKDVCFGDVFDLAVLGFGRRIVGVNDAVDSILGFAEPAFFEVVEDDSNAGFWTGDEAGICDCDGEATSEETAKLSDGMSELVFFVVVGAEVYENPKIMDPRRDFDGGAGEFGGQLVEATGSDLFFWAGYPIGRDWWVV